MSEEPWLFRELERAAEEFRRMPDEYKPVVTDGRQANDEEERARADAVADAGKGGRR